MIEEKFDIIGIGELIIDIVNDGTTSFANPGGAPFNVITTCAKYQLKTAYIGSIGNDSYGRIIQKTFDDYNISKQYLNILDTIHTVQAKVTIFPNKDRSFKFFKNNNSFTTFTNKIENLNCKIFHYGTLCLLDNHSHKVINEYVDYCVKNNISLAFDGNYRDSEMTVEEYKTIINYHLPLLNYLKLSYDEAIYLTGKTKIEEIFSFLRLYTKANILLSNGANGAYLNTMNYTIFADALKVKAVDTTGAGDILFGSFLYYVIKENLKYDEIDEKTGLKILKQAVRNASLSITKFGAIPSIPDLE